MGTKFTETQVSVQPNTKIAAQTVGDKGHVTPSALRVWLQIVLQIAWTNITGKPETFPPSAHSHTWDEIIEKPDAATVINEEDNEVALTVATHAGNFLVVQAAAGVELRLDPGLSWPEDCIIYIRRDAACGPITFSTAGSFIAPTGNAVDEIEQNGTFAIRRRGNTSHWDFI